MPEYHLPLTLDNLIVSPRESFPPTEGPELIQPDNADYE